MEIKTLLDSPAFGKVAIKYDDSLVASDYILHLLSMSNKKIIDVFKPHLQKLTEHLSRIRMILSLMVSEMEVGNDIRVSFQNRILRDAKSVLSEFEDSVQALSEYFVKRVKLVSKMEKYPHIKDYRLALEEFDDNEHHKLRWAFLEIRSKYCGIHADLLQKWDKMEE
ncbi:unnamed protein product [Ceutorhynchus assimilis]|uniref:Proteasome activator PA28 C-terminal domain-containing protein n=1 Tax=Ceutorhynchus assimilis TaxID=467358 RepID=A0A9N9QJE9_9CUCU|nr:unnamed protein product [Ceutorhynchus assimilis]